MYKCLKWSSSDKPYMTENVIVRPSHDPLGKIKIPNPYCISARHAKSYSSVSIMSTPEKLDAVQVANFTGKRNVVFQPPFDLSWKNENSETLLQGIDHFQSIICLFYEMKSSSDNNFTINVICWPLMDPWGKNENSKALLRISKTYPIRSYYTIWLQLKM